MNNAYKVYGDWSSFADHTGTFLKLEQVNTRYVLSVGVGFDEKGSYLWRVAFSYKPSDFEVLDLTKQFLDEITKSMIETQFIYAEKHIRLSELEQQNIILQYTANKPLVFRTLDNQTVEVPQEDRDTIYASISSYIISLREQNWNHKETLTMELFTK